MSTTTNELIFPVLQFVALIIPAIVILMRLVKENRGTNSSSYVLLKMSLLASLVGSFLVGLQFLIIVDELLIQVGGGFVFLSLFLVFLGLTERYLPLSAKESLFENPLLAIIEYISSGVRLMLILALMVGPHVAIYYFTHDILNEYFNLGIVYNFDILSPSVVLGTLMVGFILKSIIELQRYEAFDQDELGDIASESTAISLVYLVVIICIWGSGSILFVIPFIFLSPPLPEFGISSNLYTAFYMWVIALFVIFLVISPANNNDGDDNDDED